MATTAFRATELDRSPATPDDFSGGLPPTPDQRDLSVLRQRLSGTPAARQPDVDRILFEPVTGLPSLPVILQQLAGPLRQGRQVGLLTIHVSPITRLERLFGWKAFDELVCSVSELLQGVKTHDLRADDVLAELSASGTTFILVLAPPRQQRPLDYRTLSALRQRVQHGLAERVTQRFPPEMARLFECFIGCAVSDLEEDANLSRAVLRGLDAAYADAFSQRDTKLERQRVVLQRVIEERRIWMVFQPIVDLEAARVMGYEALARASEPEFVDVNRLFEVASQTHLLRPLEQLCWETAIEKLPALPSPDALLFLNIELESLLSPHWTEFGGLRPLANRGVLELTERAAVKDYRLFQRTLGLLSEMGLQVAIDDVGSAYSGLRVLAEAHPAFIKLDMGITRGVGQEEMRTELVGLLRKFAERSKAALIVEGVETPHELQALRSLGVRYAQGYVFGRPAAEFPTVNVAEVLAALPEDRERALARRLESIKTELAIIESLVLSADAPQRLLEEFKLALDHVRTNIWAVFNPAEPEARRRVAAHFRLVRVADMCRQVLADLHDGTITAASPDFEELRAVLQRLEL
jgi:EAL domain-containing protein (putative c-di-GMP-specific phosphodiesterase class I)